MMFARFLRPLTLLVPVIPLVGCDSPIEPADPIDALRSATQAFQQIGAATAAGYVQAGPCVASPGGGMGFHYVNQALVDGVVDPDRPEALLYAQGPAGELDLIGVEFIVVADAWDAGHSGAPDFAGQPFDDHRAADARHGLPFAHYDLHVWVWRENANGMFAPFNPAVSCS